MVIDISTPTNALSGDRYEARLFRLFAHPTRLRILRALIAHHDTVIVKDLCELTGVAQPTVSHHLAQCEAHGLVTCRRHGLECYYRVQPEKVAEAQRLLDALFPEE